MRIELTEENTKKAQAAEQQLREQEGITISPNQIVNIIMGAVDVLELKQTVSITLKGGNAQAPATQPHRKKIIVKSSSWLMNLK